MVGFHDATFLYIRLYYIHLINCLLYTSDAADE